ncbi:unnamed protein product [Soboliphyme baturini]|uniref:Complement component 1 Q subcomponent-binding protein, mitochondrial n=1 Tax=Soboliphyme baturini TaxID=241478 RepID=A0A183IPW1_9BILA|nr:unnamed protein product [Soboliphyme baturini]
MEGFKVSTNEDQVTLTKEIGKETITVKFNVSLCVDSEAMSGSSSEQEKHREESPAITCKPPFTVFIAKDKQNLVFECEFVQPYDEEELRSAGEHLADSFNIEEIYTFTDEVTEETYSVRGDIIDGELYDNLMEYLNERGINGAFAQNLIRFATHYEHAQYISLLQKMRAFVSS